MQLDATEVHDPREAGGVIDDNFFSGPSRRKRKRDRPQPVRTILRRALLIKRLALGAIHESFEHVRPIPNATNRSSRHRQVVLNDLELGQFDVAREIGLVRIGDLDLAAVDRQNFGCLFLGHCRNLLVSLGG